MKNNLILIILISTCVLVHFIFIKVERWHLPSSEIQKPVLVDGTVDSIPIKKFHGIQFQFQTRKINNQSIKTKLLIAWYSHSEQLQIGQRWKLTVKLKPPIGMHNPGGFDYVQFLQSEGITATGSVDKRGDNQLISINHHFSLMQIREKIHDDIRKAVPDPTLSAFISALCVGLRDGLTESDWQVFQKTGTNHLVAIAGLHIGFVVAMIYFLARKCWCCFPTLILKMPATPAAELISLIVALGYSALSGFAVPAQRAAIMLFCFLISNIMCRQLTLWRRWCIAFSMIMIINPYDLVDASFWLSFTSIAMLIWVMQGRLSVSKGVKSWAKMQGTILIGLLPLMFLFFQQASLIAFFTNMIAIPWVGFIMLPIVLMGCIFDLVHITFISQQLFYLSGKLLLPLWKFLSWSAHFSFASWHHAMANLFILMLCVIGALFLLSPRKMPAKWVGCFGLLPLFFYVPPHPKQNDFWLTVIDVGQGLSVLIQTAHHVMLYDAGSHMLGGFDVGESVVAPYLRLRGITTIDRVEISHGDNDHSGGAAAIVNDFKVKSFFTSAPILISQFDGQYCDAGQDWQWDGVQFATLSPKQNIPYEDNNSSCVIKISTANKQVLLTGDIQKETEDNLVQAYGNQLRSTILVVPHHGSRTSSSDEFLQAVMPRFAIISSGKYNRYHLPVQSVVDRYHARHIVVYNTADSGAVMM